MSRDPHQGHGRGVGVREQGGRGIEPCFIDGGEFRRDSLAAQQPLVRAPDAIAFLKPRSARSRFLDRARHVAADDVRKRERHGDHPRPNVEVDRVQGDRVNPHEHLSGAGLRSR